MQLLASGHSSRLIAVAPGLIITRSRASRRGSTRGLGDVAEQRSGTRERVRDRTRRRTPRGRPWTTGMKPRNSWGDRLIGFPRARSTLIG